LVFGMDLEMVVELPFSLIQESCSRIQYRTNYMGVRAVDPAIQLGERGSVDYPEFCACWRTRRHDVGTVLRRRHYPGICRTLTEGVGNEPLRVSNWATGGDEVKVSVEERNHIALSVVQCSPMEGGALIHNNGVERTHDRERLSRTSIAAN